MARRLRKAIGIGLAIVIAIGLALAVLVPVVLDGGFGRNLVRNVVADAVRGSVTVDDVDVSWTGGQVVRGLRVETVDGHPIANLDVSLDVGLLRLVTGRVDRWAVAVGGQIDIERRADGTMPFATLLTDDPDRSTRAASGGSPRPLTITFDEMMVRVIDATNDQVIELTDLEGQIVGAPGGGLSASIAGDAGRDSGEGAITIELSARDLLDANGRVSLVGASASVEVRGDSIPFRVGAETATITEYRLDASSADLSQRIDVRFGGAARVGEQDSRWEGELAISDVLEPAGPEELPFDRLSGRVTGRSIPSTLLQPLLVGTGLDAERDFGAALDLDLTADPPPTREVALTVSSGRGQVELRGAAIGDDGSWRAELLRFSDRARPEFMAAVFGLQVDRAIDVEIEVAPATLPAAGKGRFSFRRITGAGRLHVPGPFVVEAGGPITIEQVEARIETVAVADGFRVRGTAQVDGASVTFDEAFDVVDDAGRLSLEVFRPVGRITVEKLPVETLTRRMPAEATLVAEVLGATIGATVTSELGGAGALVMELIVQGEAGTAHASVAATGPLADRLEVRAAGGAFELTTPRLQQIRKGWPDEVELVHPAPAQFAFEPFALEQDVLRGAAPWPSVALTFTVPESVVRVEGPLVEPVTVREFTTHAEFGGGESSAVTGRVEMQLHRSTGDARIGSVSIDAVVHDPGQTPVVEATGHLTQLSSAELEAAMGQAPGTLSGWLGTGGEVTIATVPHRADGYDFEIDTSFERLDARLDVQLDEHRVVITSEPVAVTVPPSAFEAFLHGAGPESEPRVRVVADVPANVTVRRLVLPRGIGKDVPGGWRPGAFDVHVAGGPLDLEPEGMRCRLGDFRIDAHRDAPAGPIEFAATSHGRLVEPASDERSTLDAKGTFTGASEGEAARLDLEVRAENLAAAVIDAVAKTGGIVASSLGAQIDITIDATTVSPRSGRIDAQVTASLGRAEAHLESRDGVLVTAESQTVVAELKATPELCHALLQYIHPVLGGIVSAEQPLHIVLSNARLPLDGDLSKLDGHVHIEVGKVEFAAESSFLGVLEVFEDAAGTSGTRTISGDVDVIEATIVAGVVTYDHFVIRIGEYELPYTGSVDLVNERLDIRTQVPVGVLDAGIQSIPFIPTGIAVPVHNHGPFDNVSTDVEVGGLIANIPDAFLGKLFRGGGKVD